MFNNASNYANSVDSVMMLITVISAILLFGVTFVMIYFVFRYSRKRNPVATQIHENLGLEIAFVVIPTILVMIMFWYGFDGFRKLRAETDGAYEVKAYAFMWGWNFQYENGKQSDTLYIPLSKITKVRLTSRDVVHSFFIPAFRLKEDVVAGKEHYVVLTPKEVGSYDIACAEYCGLNHSKMYTRLKVLKDDEFNQWLQGGIANNNSTNKQQ
ncbi:MAG TPA: cytochrome c oxidase subunit II [Candidatus Kapabacteria bacterium]|nr:cytochrome c oxidase subunit II [Candidatus Kapabacteria bacterium]